MTFHLGWGQLHQGDADACKPPCLQAEGETYLGEVGAISEAYEAAQEQNVRLMQQLTERDEANASLVSERIRVGHGAAQMAEARDSAVAAAKRASADAAALRGLLANLDARLQVG